MNFLIDTHAHLADEKLSNNLYQIIEECQKYNVNKIISIGCTLDEAEKSIQIAEKYKNIVYATAGLYPHDNADENESRLNNEERLTKLEELAGNKTVIAIGECGLDYTTPPPYEKKRSKDDQYYLFYQQLLLAEKLDKPIIIHSREAPADTISLLKESRREHNFEAVWHCFTEGYDIAEQVLDTGLMMSFTGIITYPKSLELRETVAKIPLDKIMIETDSPYLIPQIARKNGIKINNPGYVRMVAQEISYIKGVKLDKVIEVTTKNACDFFKL